MARRGGNERFVGEEIVTFTLPISVIAEVTTALAERVVSLQDQAVKNGPRGPYWRKKAEHCVRCAEIFRVASAGK